MRSRTREEMIQDIIEFLKEGREVETRIISYVRLNSDVGKELLQELVDDGLLLSWKDKSPYSNRPCTMYQLIHQYSEEDVIETFSTTR